MPAQSPAAVPTLTAPPPGPAAGWRALLRARWVWAVVVVELLVAAAVAGGLWVLRRQTLAGELRTLASLSAAMAVQADSTLDVAQAVLRATRDELQRGLLVPGAESAHALLVARTQPLARFRALSIFDARGERVATSRGAAAAPVSAAGTDFFAAARASGSAGLFISAPYVAPSDGLPAISLSLDWRGADGVFRGVIVLVAAPDFLDGGFERIAPTPDTRLALYRVDGSPLHGNGGSGLAAAQVQALRVDAAAGTTRLVDQPDGGRRLAAANALRSHALTVVVTREAREVLAAWTELAWLVGAFVASALSVTLLLALRYGHEQLLRRAGQAQRRQLEEQLQRARKLEALGKLAGGMAHDFNNILASVVGFGELARQGAAHGSSQARQLDQVLQAGQRGRALVERILSFSRGNPRPLVVFRLQPVLAEVLEHLAQSGWLQQGHRIDAALNAADAAIVGDTTMVYEAAMNLCRNALQAMPDGGALRVTLDRVAIDRPQALFDSTLPPGDHARLVVADQGIGMTPEVMARLFEPFFTTKGPQEGTGLGLAVVHGVVADLRGAIDVHSRPGAGTRFTLYFPLAAGRPVDDDRGVNLDGAVPLGEGQVVLVVDDEPALVTLAEELLAGLGYEAFGVSSSSEALARFRAQPTRFDIVLTDERMPGLSGTELARALRSIRPELPVVLASGFGGAQLEARAAASGITALASKPFTRAELARVMAAAWRRRALPASGPGAESEPEASRRGT